jgi:hypothetical protein
MDEHTSVLPVRIRALAMEVPWCQEQDCHSKIWSSCSFILQAYTAQV